MRRWGARRTLRVGVLGLLLVCGLESTTPASAAAATCPDVLPASLSDQLAARYPGIAFTAAVYDTRSGCWDHLRAGAQLRTASVIKAQVLGAVLRKAQAEGRALTSWERSHIAPMIQYSSNPDTSVLYGHVGYAPGMEATDGAFGATNTIHTSKFGATLSTAVDRTRVALRLLYEGGALDQSRREVAWRYLTSVHPLQEWGISAGVPVGWTVGQKNGFYPSSGIGWVVGSSGFVRQDDADQGYAITIMTQGASAQRTGIRLVEEVARRVSAALTVGPGDERPIDRARCVQASAGESWAGVAARLGLPASRAGEVRITSGGNPSPLSGQMACSPDIPGEEVQAGSTVSGRHRPVIADLDCDGYDDVVWYAEGAAPDAIRLGHPDRRFRKRGVAISGDYIPIGGDFDGDGCGDVLWYGRGSQPDRLWSGGSTISSSPITVSGAGYVPRSGDFDADGRTDVLWYRPGTGADYVWYGQATRGRFTGVSVNAGRAAVPVIGDFDGNGASDVHWYVRGASPDRLWRGTPGVRQPSGSDTINVGLAYRPVTTDGDGDGVDELLWYAPGAADDTRWEGVPPAVARTSFTVDGDYLPLRGDFDGDGFGDVLWYGPGGGPERLWWGRADGKVDRTGFIPA